MPPGVGGLEEAPVTVSTGRVLAVPHSPREVGGAEQIAKVGEDVLRLGSQTRASFLGTLVSSLALGISLRQPAPPSRAVLWNPSGLITSALSHLQELCCSREEGEMWCLLLMSLVCCKIV